MEAVPLTLAHTHARNAVLETRKSNPVAASEEHDLAAGEFATAAQHCSDLYARRTLQLLEQEHKRLAAVLRSQHENPPSVVTEPAHAQTPSSPSLSRDAQASVPTKSAAPVNSSNPQQVPPRLPDSSRQLQRDTSSIASNLASARGIPSQPRRASPASPFVSAQHAGAQIADSAGRVKIGESRTRDINVQNMRDRASQRGSATKQPWSPPTTGLSETTSRQHEPLDGQERGNRRSRLPTSDEPFQRFYSTFGGLISKISAPLAFAGLPLGADSESPRQKALAETKVDRHHATPERSSLPSDPDINKIFSKAALRAIRDANGGMPSNATESFYVVPTTGGTVSYASILSRADKETRRNSTEDGADEDFVDARETPPSPEMLHSLSGAKAKTGHDRSTKTLEELQMENEALRQLTDTLSKRLHMWEVNAQSSSVALQQSLRAMHHHQAVAPATSSAASASQAESERRLREMEEQLRRREREIERVSRENEKLKATLGKYRDRWEKLKEGAKTRRNTEGAAAKNNQGTPVTKPESEPTTPANETPEPANRNEGAEI